MNEESDGNDEESMDLVFPENSKTKRQLSVDEITEIIGNTQEKPRKKLAAGKDKNTADKQVTDKPRSSASISTTSKKTTTNNETTKNNIFKSSTNSSLRMKEITNKKCKHLYYINTDKNTSRLLMSDTWKLNRGNINDVILQTKKGFILKSNTDKNLLVERLEKLKQEGKITKFEETVEKEQQPKNNIPISSYSAVIASVEQEITDEELSNYLKRINIEHRFCKRIMSKKYGKNTYLVRIITGDIQSFEKLLNEGLFYKNRHYAVYPSLPPAPAPMACANCVSFEHKTEDCSTPVICQKCQGNHSTSKCATQLPIKCGACGAEDHAAWSFKCPRRPTAAIPNIPNIPIRSINRKTDEISSDLKKESRVHSAVTKHDFIIQTYLEEVNKPKNTNREQIIHQIKKRFIDLWRIDTTAVFTQNRLYILMFDLNVDEDSPTEPTSSPNNLQWRA